MPVVTFSPTSGLDDGSGAGGSDGDPNPPNSSFYIESTSTSADLLTNNNNNRSFCRFPGVIVPRGATINLATVTYSLTSTKSNSYSLAIGAEAVDNSPSLLPGNSALGSAAAVDLKSRVMTAAKTSISSIPSGSSLSVSITSAIQEIVNRSGWQSGNALSVITQAGARTGGAARQFYTYENGSSLPVLSIDYAAADSGPEPGRFFLSP